MQQAPSLFCLQDDVWHSVIRSLSFKDKVCLEKTCKHMRTKMSRIYVLDATSSKTMWITLDDKELSVTLAIFPMYNSIVYGVEVERSPSGPSFLRLVDGGLKKFVRKTASGGVADLRLRHFPAGRAKKNECPSSSLYMDHWDAERGRIIVPEGHRYNCEQSFCLKPAYLKQLLLVVDAAVVSPTLARITATGAFCAGNDLRQILHSSSGTLKNLNVDSGSHELRASLNGLDRVQSASFCSARFPNLSQLALRFQPGSSHDRILPDKEATAFETLLKTNTSIRHLDLSNLWALLVGCLRRFFTEADSHLQSLTLEASVASIHVLNKLAERVQNAVRKKEWVSLFFRTTKEINHLQIRMNIKKDDPTSNEVPRSLASLVEETPMDLTFFYYTPVLFPRLNRLTFVDYESLETHENDSELDDTDCICLGEMSQNSSVAQGTTMDTSKSSILSTDKVDDTSSDNSVCTWFSSGNRKDNFLMAIFCSMATWFLRTKYERTLVVSLLRSDHLGSLNEAKWNDYFSLLEKKGVEMFIDTFENCSRLSPLVSDVLRENNGLQRLSVLRMRLSEATIIFIYPTGIMRTNIKRQWHPEMREENIRIRGDGTEKTTNGPFDPTADHVDPATLSCFVLQNVAKYLPASDKIRCERVSKTWESLLKKKCWSKSPSGRTVTIFIYDSLRMVEVEMYPGYTTAVFSGAKGCKYLVKGMTSLLRKGKVADVGIEVLNLVHFTVDQTEEAFYKGCWLPILYQKQLVSFVVSVASQCQVKKLNARGFFALRLSAVLNNVHNNLEAFSLDFDNSDITPSSTFQGGLSHVDMPCLTAMKVRLLRSSLQRLMREPDRVLFSSILIGKPLLETLQLGSLGSVLAYDLLVMFGRLESKLIHLVFKANPSTSYLLGKFFRKLLQQKTDLSASVVRKLNSIRTVKLRFEHDRRDQEIELDPEILFDPYTRQDMKERDQRPDHEFSDRPLLYQKMESAGMLPLCFPCIERVTYYNYAGFGEHASLLSSDEEASSWCSDGSELTNEFFAMAQKWLKSDRDQKHLCVAFLHSNILAEQDWGDKFFEIRFEGIKVSEVSWTDPVARCDSEFLSILTENAGKQPLKAALLSAEEKVLKLVYPCGPIIFTGKDWNPFSSVAPEEHKDEAMATDCEEDMMSEKDSDALDRDRMDAAFDPHRMDDALDPDRMDDALDPDRMDDN